MKNLAKRLSNFFLIIAVSVVLFGSGYKLGQKNYFSSASGQAPAVKNKVSDFSLFWDVWDKVEAKYVDKKKIDVKKMYFGAIKGMVASLEDPYTFFLTPEENQQSKDDLGGKFDGIGAQLGLKDNRITVIAPLKDSPAVRAGVKAGDFINAVDGKSTKDWTLPQAVSKIRGEKGTKVLLTLERDGKEIKIPIIRDRIIVDSVDLSFKKGVAVLKINQFGDNTDAEWDNAINQIKAEWDAKKIKGMVLDLRDNPGGYLDSSVYLASDFLKEGDLIVKQESSYGSSREYHSDRNGRLLDIPLVVIINRGSASASEILAGALRDHKKATLIGEKSFGKGSIQEAIDLQKGAGLHITVAKWILPGGDWINSKGIEPKIKVENEIKEGNTLTDEDDKQLKKAVDLLTDNK